MKRQVIAVKSICMECKKHHEQLIELDVFTATIRDLTKFGIKNLLDEDGAFICHCDSCKPFQLSDARGLFQK